MEKVFEIAYLQGEVYIARIKANSFEEAEKFFSEGSYNDSEDKYIETRTEVLDIAETENDDVE